MPPTNRRARLNSPTAGCRVFGAERRSSLHGPDAAAAEVSVTASNDRLCILRHCRSASAPD